MGRVCRDAGVGRTTVGRSECSEPRTHSHPMPVRPNPAWGISSGAPPGMLPHSVGPVAGQLGLALGALLLHHHPGVVPLDSSVPAVCDAVAAAPGPGPPSAPPGRPTIPGGPLAPAEALAGLTRGARACAAPQVKR